jgi:hypothetical protein
MNQPLKSMFKPYHLFTSLAVSAVLFAATGARAQQIYSEDFSNPDVATNWVVNPGDSGSNYVNFQFDYTTAGLPPAPHSQGGNTKGLKMSPDITTGPHLGTSAVNGLSVTPTNFSITANFDMHADMWINYNGAGSATKFQTNGSGSGSTVVYGCGYGTAGNSPQTAGSIDSILCGMQTDNGSSAQVRMYGPLQAGSYQDFVYQSSGTIAPSFPGEPFVYNSPNGSRAFYAQATWLTAPSPNWTNYYPNVAPPAAQVNLYPQQTNIFSNLGAPNFGWHDVEVQKVGNVIVYLLDGHIVATGNYSSAGTPAGDKLVFTAFDINSSPSTDPNFANLNFVVFANIVVSNFPTVVNVTATVPTASEADPSTPGVFTLTRSTTTGPLTVNFTLTGTATNGVQYQTVPLNVTFLDGEANATVNINPIDDGVSRPTGVVALNLQQGQGFGAAGSAIINILDNDQPTVDISGSSQAYGRYTNTVGSGNNDFVLLTLTRRGRLATGTPLTVNLSYPSGSAVNGVDYTQVPSVVIPDGSSSNAVMISPVYNPSVYTNRTFTVTVASGSGYAIGTGTGTGTIVPASSVPAPVIFTDALTNADGGTNWNLVYGSGDTMLNTNNFSADFGFDLTTAAGGAIPPPPSGDPHALHLTANKNLDPGAPGAINAYLTNKLLSGNYAVRFQMNLIQGNSGQTEGAVFGINHSGSLSNWWYGNGPITNINWSSDGVWYYVTDQAGGSSAGDYQEFTGLGGTNGNTGWTRVATKSASSFSDTFKANPGPFTALGSTLANSTPGVPANEYTLFGDDNSTWADVEIKQQDGVVTLSINHTQIFTYTNTTVWKSGYLMLGYADPFGAADSKGTPDAGVYYANLQIVQLPTIRIDNIAVTNNNDVIQFTTSDPLDVSTAFNLLTSTNILGTFTNLTGTFAPVSGTQFQVTTPFTGGFQRYFKVTHK